MKTILASAALALSRVLAPGAALAQADVAGPPDEGPEASASTPPANALRIKIDYDQTGDLDNLLLLDLSNGQRVPIRLMKEWAPNHVERIKTLTRQGFYNGLAFFRVIEGFMAQAGDPQNNGTGGSTLPDVPAEFNGGLHLRGAVGMARAQDPNSANSQFYIMFVPRLQMDRVYAVFGRVVSGMNYVDAIERGEPPAQPSRILRASLGSDNVPPMTAEQIQTETARLAAAAGDAAPLTGPRAVGPAMPPPPTYRPLEPVRGEGAPPRRRQGQ